MCVASCGGHTVLSSLNQPALQRTLIRVQLVDVLIHVLGDGAHQCSKCGLVCADAIHGVVEALCKERQGW